MIGKGRLYVIVNKDLGMSAGKVAAQVAHAVARIDAYPPHVTVILGGTTEQIHNLDEYMTRAKMPHHMYIDEGANEVPPMSATALAFKAGIKIPDFVERFNLYVDQTPYKLKNAKFEIERLKQDVEYYRKFFKSYCNIPEKIRNKYGGR